ncbi:hypothetical protein [Enterococcus lactis]|uniref:Uncharacterized protein n=1 Tax=Enterococcus lactis TaxID=357441 RepID=A0AAJ1WEF6_9ENTE|nr:hypothetical protein [Enterococcus lactis]MDP8584466.1 hypothetical protein [Listeria innocua]MDP8590877.1 hypothetical protein [Enterococcus lactis]
MAEDQRYVDMDGMQERVDAAYKEHLDKVWGKVKADTNEVVETNQEVTALWGKAVQRDIDEEKKKVIADMEAEKARAIKEIEEKYGRKSTKLQVTKQEDEDADLKAMLRNINSRS